MEALVTIGVPVVMLPDAHLRKLLTFTLAAPTLLSPGYVRTSILENAWKMESACSNRPELSAALLSYCLLDIDDTNPYDLVRLHTDDLHAIFWTLHLSRNPVL